MSSNVKIEIAAEYTGKPAFMQATKNVSALERSVKSLSKSFATLFVTGKIAQYARESAKALAEDQKSAAQLNNAVKNLGLSLSSLELENFVQKLQNSAGVLDQELRPALQKLLTTTGSITKSQELLTQAIDISRGSGQDLGTVVTDLSNAYVGITRGLKKYALGLTQAELKAMSFQQIQEKLNKQFSGASAAYLQTYAGKFDTLSVAFDNAKETLGAGVLDAFAELAGGKTTEDAIKNINAIAEGLANVVRAGGMVASVFVRLYKAIDYVATLGGFFGTGGKLAQMSKGGGLTTNRSSSPAGSWARTQQQRTAEAAAAKRAKELAAAQTKQTAALKEQTKLKKQSALFDLEQIQLVAALKGKLSDEERDRVLLQLAILQGNETEAARLSARIADSIDQTGKLKAYVQDLQNVGDPFKSWVTSLQEAARLMAQMANGNTVGNTQISPTSPSYDVGGHLIGSLIENFTPPPSGTYGGSAGTITDASSFAGVVKVVIDGKEIASSLQDQSLSGNNTTVYRNRGAFNVL